MIKKSMVLGGFLLVFYPMVADKLGDLAAGLKDVGYIILGPTALTSQELLQWRVTHKNKAYKPYFTQGVEYSFSQVGGPTNIKIYIKQGDMFEQGAQVIVNAANHELQGGGGVDGAVEAATEKYSGIIGTDINNNNEKLRSRAKIVNCCWASGKPNDWGEGKAFLNTSDNMKVACDHSGLSGKLVPGKDALKNDEVNVMDVIQAVGPKPPAEELLQDAFRNSLKAADVNGKTSIALPFISGGIFWFWH